MQDYLLAVDIGNAETKTESGIQFISGVSRDIVKPKYAGEILTYEGDYYLLSKKRLPYMPERTHDENHFILALFALAKELKRAGNTPREVNLTIATGLPIAAYSIRSETYADYFMKHSDFSFSYEDQQYQCHIEKTLVYIQGLSALLLCDFDYSSAHRAILVDIGGYTVDAAEMHYGKLNTDFVRSYNMGIITFTNEVLAKINRTFGEEYREQDILEMLKSPRLPGVPQKIINFVHQEASGYATSILEVLREEHVNLNSTLLVFAGGGAQLLQTFLSAAEPAMRCCYIKDPCANAKGYGILARKELQRI